ncbi:uncharacterized protein LOC105155578 isoform X3 [Sesamum indicum]|uniref:Uncharacterized protein LOC105155578 isoform X3 n=1 Tax=Sesamum indicum TaxID=4182 RepID=A0A8M8VDI7_SESIN|nr:uncharacterized protein LOC105155578 isoform X3 [Sesamum indicum]
MVKSLVAPSVTKQQIADYWRQRRMIEEDHFSAAIKAAARIRAQKLSQENDYFQFEASLEDDENMENKNKISVKAASKKDENEERRVGIKDWQVEKFPERPKLYSVFQIEMMLSGGLRADTHT